MRPDPRRLNHVRAVVAKATADGELVPATQCSRCGTSAAKIVGHHSDYSRPLDVEWLCVGCHFIRHNEEGTGTAGRSRCPACGRIIYRHVQDAGLVRIMDDRMFHAKCVA